ncbi:hypothetical protein AC568_09285 [Mannheimia haemolytica]|nr:hypothetical protein B824_25800 [Mannheimia haemolytica USDA-ARS-USMARC-184]KYL07126.1 hypothetical protein AC568_09285 [Mannheimia haemolytica]
MKNNLLNYLKIILFTYLFSRVLNYIIAQFNFPDVPSHLAMVGSFLKYWKNARRNGETMK